VLYFLFFFFQAEDGIRDFHVTGVQTCALPISYEAISRAALERGWEFMGHGFGQKNMQKVPDERADIRATADAIRAFTGKMPRGWLGPGLTETWETPDLLVEEGFDYVCD